MSRNDRDMAASYPELAGLADRVDARTARPIRPMEPPPGGQTADDDSVDLMGHRAEPDPQGMARNSYGYGEPQSRPGP